MSVSGIFGGVLRRLFCPFLEQGCEVSFVLICFGLQSCQLRVSFGKRLLRSSFVNLVLNSACPMVSLPLWVGGRAKGGQIG